ncbi:succinylglutamate-semialdehyde dehydrogenase [Sphingobium sufflavum]|uniref:succinylglutamate-semialdehyde dehydrogenase n=1 Tax=Sphingobium sufflavum TaxID=1129547 RepID=UPI001F265FE0|nr:succinylglutamate-semialdehyde dehydrogenase [Sphingobium sufflavum]MCE7796068.1 succinylglutamate-semialdehyde dehydrogenase [Sphingobium sufflavum]
MATLTSTEPATGLPLWQGEESDVGAAVARVAAAWPQWAARPFSYRIEAMRRFANLVRGREVDLADLIARETGKPVWDAKGEVATLLESVEQSITAYSARTGQKRLDGTMGARAALRHKPHGVMAIITPHCTPALLPVAQIAPALIAGNGVLFKPSEKVPATGQFIATLMHEAGVPQDVLSCIIGDAAAGQALVAHDGVAGIVFTGSAHVGLSINRALATRPDRIAALHMGGNNPMILWDMADIRTATALIIQSSFLSTGQNCTSGRRLIVRDSMADAIIENLRETTNRLVIDAPHADPSPYMGPIIDMEMADGLTESFLYLMSNGGRPITHMRRPKDDLPFVTPGIIDVTAMEKRIDIELFGPILQIVRVDDFDRAIAEANATRFGLSAALFGGSEEQYDRFWAASRAGLVNWNRPLTGSAPGFPAGGVGLSGNHRAGGAYAADYCAYPVASAEIAQARASVGVGLRSVEVIADR